MVRAAALALLLSACKANPEPGDAWIAPLDGQTDVGPDDALRVLVDGLQLPPDYPVPDDFVRVLDLDADGAFLPGVVTVDEGSITFAPDAPWEAGRRYAWSLGELPAMDRAPEFNLGDDAYGEAVFATTGALEVLDAAIEAGGRICALLSRRLSSARAAEPVTATVDDAPVAVGALDLRPEAEFLSDASADLVADGLVQDGVSVACFPELVAAPGAALALWWGDDGPWRFTLEEVPVGDLILARRSPR